MVAARRRLNAAMVMVGGLNVARQNTERDERRAAGLHPADESPFTSCPHGATLAVTCEH